MTSDQANDVGSHHHNVAIGDNLPRLLRQAIFDGGDRCPWARWGSHSSAARNPTSPAHRVAVLGYA